MFQKVSRIQVWKKAPSVTSSLSRTPLRLHMCFQELADFVFPLRNHGISLTVCPPHTRSVCSAPWCQHNSEQRLKGVPSALSKLGTLAWGCYLTEVGSFPPLFSHRALLFSAPVRHLPHQLPPTFFIVLFSLGGRTSGH